MVALTLSREEIQKEFSEFSSQYNKYQITLVLSNKNSFVLNFKLKFHGNFDQSLTQFKYNTYVHIYIHVYNI